MRMLKMFRMHDIIVILALALMWLVMALLINRFLSPQNAFLISVFVLSISVSLTYNVIKKIGTAPIFLVIVSLLTFSLDNLGATGIKKVIVLFAAGIIFELLVLVFRIGFRNLQLALMAGASFAAASIPLTMGLIYSFNVVSSMIIPIINLILVSLFLGFVGSGISVLLWSYLSTTKLFVKFEYLLDISL
ncbi:MAG: hypothetical protein KKE20_01880 [Nanoarchaeota archaeon]|nr:hypothetical protein [Nanoarchaeota archaeon]